ncbi:MAG: TfoX/Sxy family protein [Hyphomonadaceae bacterium]|nr:TfoX/Sxy family protein [Hyphomonadaceae bacterium]
MSTAAKVRVRLVPVMIRLLAWMMVGAIIDVHVNDMPVADLDYVG